MNRTIIMYDTTSEKMKQAAQYYSLIIGYAKEYDWNAECDLNQYENAIFCVDDSKQTPDNFQGVRNQKDRLKLLRTAVIMIDAADVNRESEEDKWKMALGKELDYFYYGSVSKKELCDSAKELQEIFQEIYMDSGEPELKESIEEFLKSHNTCCLSSTVGDVIRTTPIEYLYLNNALYIITEGGLKYYGILQNPKVAIGIYEPFAKMTSLKGMQIDGRAELVKEESQEYEQVVAKKGLTRQSLGKFPVVLNVLRIEIDTVEFLNSDFKKSGKQSKLGTRW